MGKPSEKTITNEMIIKKGERTITDNKLSMKSTILFILGMLLGKDNLDTVSFYQTTSMRKK